MALHLLSARQVQVAAVGTHQDGGGLSLVVTSTGASWVLRFTAPDGRRREMGCGPAHRETLAAAGATLTAARKIATDARALIAQGVDPIARRQADRDAALAATAAQKAAAKTEATTLARVARAYHSAVVEPQRTPVHSREWLASLERHVPASIWHAPIDSIEPAELLRALAPLRKSIPETCDRVRQRLEAVFDDAIFHKLCAMNPATVVRRKLAERPAGRQPGHFRAMAYADVPEFVEKLRERTGNAARCLEFALACVVRTGDVLGAVWDEFDTVAGTWTIPGQRLKGSKLKARSDHVVHLTPRALAIVGAQREQQSKYVFPSPLNAEKPMSTMAMLTVLRRMGVAADTTVHGLCRSSFSTWANESAAGRPDVVEAALCHIDGNKVRAAYNRADFSAERRALLIAWGRFCAGEQPVASTAPASASVHHLAAAA